MNRLCLVFLFISLPLLASTPIGTYIIDREFNSHQPTEAHEIGFPLNPGLVSMKAHREDIFSQPTFEINYRLSSRGPLISAKVPGQIIRKDEKSAEVKVILSSHGEQGASCGPHDMKIFYVVFRIGLQGEYANGHRFFGVREWTNDNCHEPMKLETFTYTIDE